LKKLKKILTAAQIRDADLFTIASEPIASIDLMERAAEAFVDEASKIIQQKDRVFIISGIGNNGGDGLAIARLLKEKNFRIEVCLIQLHDKLSTDCQQNLLKLNEIIYVKHISELPVLTNYDILIDALFGSGLNRPADGLAAEVIEKINASNTLIISVDVPSGMYCDTVTPSKNMVKSDCCITFQRPKLSFFLPEHVPYIKSYITVDIGIDEDFIQETNGMYYLLDDTIAKSVHIRAKQSHKGTYGHALLMTGSYGKMGAAILSTKACLCSGVGLITSYIPSCGYEILQISIPEAMCITDQDAIQLTQLPNIDTYNAVGIGPGVGTNSQTQQVVAALLQNSTDKKFVLDADAINILATDKSLLKLLPFECILTPHPKEFQRLVGGWQDSAERLQKQRDFALQYKCILILKDAHTSICSSKGEIYFNTSGNPGMATGGSGDVLTGIITGLLAQQYSPLEAALIGAVSYTHLRAHET